MIWEFQSPTLVCSYSLASASVVSQAYILVSLIIELYIYRSGHGIETHLRSNLAQLVEGYGLGIAMVMLASYHRCQWQLHTDDGLFSAVIFKYV